MHSLPQELNLRDFIPDVLRTAEDTVHVEGIPAVWTSHMSTQVQKKSRHCPDLIFFFNFQTSGFNEFKSGCSIGK